MILPGEDPEAYRHRLDAWIGKFQPGDDVELYLVQHAVHASWQLDRADRAELARLVEAIDEEADKRADDIAKVGEMLFRTPPKRPPGADPDRLDNDANTPILSWPFEPEHPQHPARLIAALESTAAGCTWLLERWDALGKLLDEGKAWQPLDRLRAIRLLGKQPLDLVADQSVMAIYLACHAMDPEGPDVFAQPLGDLFRPQEQAQGERLTTRFAAARAERAPRDADEARSVLRAIMAPAVARLEALREVRAAAEAADRADISARTSYDAKVSLDWLRKHQATCSRALYRSFDELRKLRRDFGDDGPEVDEPLAADEIDPFSPPASAFRVPPEVVAPEALAPMGPEPAAVEPAGDGDAAPDVTNEASGPSGATDDGQRSKTNEASGPSQGVVRPVPAVPVTAMALLVLLLTAGLTAVFATSVKVSDPGYSSRGQGDDQKSQRQYTKGFESIVQAGPPHGTGEGLCSSSDTIYEINIFSCRLFFKFHPGRRPGLRTAERDSWSGGGTPSATGARAPAAGPVVAEHPTMGSEPVNRTLKRGPS